MEPAETAPWFHFRYGAKAETGREVRSPEWLVCLDPCSTGGVGIVWGNRTARVGSDMRDGIRNVARDTNHDPTT